MSGAFEAGDGRLAGLLRAMRSFQSGDIAARAPIAPGETDDVAELTRLFNAIAERTQLLEERGSQARSAAESGSARTVRTGSEPPRVAANDLPAIAVFENAAAPDGLEPMYAMANNVVRGLGGAWDRAKVLRVHSPEQLLEAAARYQVLCALLDARGPHEGLFAMAGKLATALPDIPAVFFAPDGDPAAADRAAEAALGHSRAEIARSAGAATERLTLHWLTSAPSADELTVEVADPGYGRIRFAGEKVLIVDDDVRNVFALVSALELYGLTALAADSGFEAIELLQRTPDVSLILMDLMMPGLDGYATTARIRATPASAYLPIIAVTARAAEADRERSLAAGFDGHVTKPVEVEQLLSLIRGLIRV